MRIGALVGSTVLALLPACTERKSEPVGSSSPPSTTSAKSEPKPASQLDAGIAAPPVPPLMPGESPPAKGPNYFEPTEMASTGIATAYQSCLSSLERTDADLPTWKAVPYCSCIVDAWRTNIHASGNPETAPRPTADQIKRCGNLDGGAGPFAVAFPKDTPDLYNAWKTCIEKFSTLDHGVYCGCYTDGVFKNPGFLKISPEDDKRCLVADQYWAATKTHLTVRQFQALQPLGIAPR
jgi:hypothetical protein